MNILTSDSSNGALRAQTVGSETVEFVSRMFAPRSLPFPEDHVCGPAHCLSTPYWSRKKSIVPGKEINAAHVSQRGGALVVSWDEQNSLVKIRGVLQTFAKGTVFI